MIGLFRSNKPDHPMAEPKEARKLLDELPAGDALACIDELRHWLESALAEDGFKPEYRAQLVQLLDETAQPHLRKLAREYVASPRLARAREMLLWQAMSEYFRQAAQGYLGCAELYAGGVKGADALKGGMPLLLARALRALGARLKWSYLRYGPLDATVWGAIGRAYALAESHKFAQSTVALYPGTPGEVTPQQEFQKALMFCVSSPASLAPLEMELCERLIAHFCAAFTLSQELPPERAYAFDLAAAKPPVRAALAPARAPTLRLFAAGAALQQLQLLGAAIKSSGQVPAEVNLGGSYPAQAVLDVLQHLGAYWSSEPPQRRHRRHRVKSRLNVVHGYDAAVALLRGEAAPDESETETWVVENVSAGGFGALVPELKGDWLKIGSLLALQPEGGDNWLLGVVRRLQREAPQQAAVGIQTVAKAAQLVQLRLSGGGTETGIAIAADLDAPGEARLLLRARAFAPGENMEYRKGEANCLLLPQDVLQGGEDYQLVRFRELVRDDGD